MREYWPIQPVSDERHCRRAADPEYRDINNDTMGGKGIAWGLLLSLILFATIAFVWYGVKHVYGG